MFGFGVFPGVLALVIWSFATSIAVYRAAATTDRKFVAATQPQASMVASKDLR